MSVNAVTQDDLPIRESGHPLDLRKLRQEPDPQPLSPQKTRKVQTNTNNNLEKTKETEKKKEINFNFLRKEYPFIVLSENKKDTTENVSIDFSNWLTFPELGKYAPKTKISTQRNEKNDTIIPTTTEISVLPKADSISTEEIAEVISDTVILESVKEDTASVILTADSSSFQTISDTLLSKETLTITEENKEYNLRNTPLPKRIQSEIWFTPLLFLMFFLYGLVFSRRKKDLFQDIKDFFSLNSYSRKDSFADSFQSRMLLVFLGIINISLFCFFAFTMQASEPGSVNAILTLSVFLCFIFVFILFKILTIKLICYVFFDKNLSYRWTRTFNSLILFSGIALIPSILSISYGPTLWVGWSIGLGIALCSLLAIIYIVQIATFFFKNITSLFYLILYLCSLEVLPALGLFLGLKAIVEMA